MNNSIVSIIIPTYNCEQYLPQCIDSLLSQTFQNFEIIVVDDGSSDRTFEIVQQYAKSLPNIHAYQQQHAFAGVARNFGITKAQGKYLLFLDGDDYFEPQLLENAYRRITETDADICAFGALSLNNETGKVTKLKHTCKTELCPTSGTFNRTTNTRYLYCFTTPAPWTKMYKKSFVLENDLRFQETRSANDFCFVHTALSTASKIAVLGEYLVTYRQHNSASLQATQGRDPLAFYQALTALKKQLEKRGLYGELRHTFENTALDFCMYNLRTLRYDLVSQERVFAFLRDTGFAELGLNDKPRDYFYVYPKSRYDDYLLVCEGSFEQYRSKTAPAGAGGRKKSFRDRLRSVIPLRASVFEKSKHDLNKEIAELKEQNRDLSDKLAKCMEMLEEMRGR